jgi:catechol 2,3-dioxygenase-like lactoylglutathione lyase family enzyme
VITVNAIDHLVLNVRDVDASAAWYAKVLGMVREDRPSPSGLRTTMKFGRHKINLRPIQASQEDWFTGLTPQPGGDDLCFLTDATPADVLAHIERCSVTVLLGPVPKSGAQGEICSVYVRDPDGNLVEISSYR